MTGLALVASLAFGLMVGCTRDIQAVSARSFEPSPTKYFVFIGKKKDLKKLEPEEEVESTRRDGSVNTKITIDEIRAAGWYDKIWQSFGVLLPVKTVGVMGDERTYAEVFAIRAVHSVDGMTADWVQMPYELLAKISTRVVNEVRGINRVVYDVTSKPPGTIEWE